MSLLSSGVDRLSPRTRLSNGFMQCFLNGRFVDTKAQAAVKVAGSGQLHFSGMRQEHELNRLGFAEVVQVALVGRAAGQVDALDVNLVVFVSRFDQRAFTNGFERDGRAHAAAVRAGAVWLPVRLRQLVVVNERTGCDFFGSLDRAPTPEYVHFVAHRNRRLEITIGKVYSPTIYCLLNNRLNCQTFDTVSAFMHITWLLGPG